MLNLCLWIGNICNGLLLGNASIARGLTEGLKKIMVYKIPPGGGGKPYLASGLHVFRNERENKKKKKTWTHNEDQPGHPSSLNRI